MLEPGAGRRSWALFVRSLRVIAHDRKLLVLPAASFACGMLMLLLFSILFLAPALFEPNQYSWLDFRHWEQFAHRWVSLFSFSDPSRPKPHLTDDAYKRFLSVSGNLAIWSGCLALMMALSLFGGLLNAAFYNETIRALAGERVSLRNGVRVACRRFRPLLNWFVFSGLIVGLLRFAGGRFGIAGRIAGSLLGMSWSAASFFAIPVLLREKKAGNAPLALLRTSATLVKSTWGESAVGYVGFQILGLPFWLCAAAAYACFRVFGAFPPILVGVVIGVGMVWVLWSRLLGAAHDIYRCALYIYATEGVVPDPFTSEQMDTAWKIKAPARD